MTIAGRVLFDTNLVNMTLDYGGFIFDGGEIPNISDWAIDDVIALRSIFLTGQRASWQLAISPLTYHEITATRNLVRRAEVIAMVQRPLVLLALLFRNG